MLGLGSLLQADLTKVGNTVTDSVTNLEWLDDEASPSENWQVAIDYCEAKNIDSKDDWRLPNVNELSTLLDSDDRDSIFTNTSASYWSSTTHATDTINAWLVYFNDGSQDISLKSNSVSVRCVRAGQ
jgi:hypothetical protein